MVQMDVTVAEVNSTTFWRYPFDSICNPKQLMEYIIMDIDLILNKDRRTFPGQGAVSSKVFRYDDIT
jgi:nonsense-mediated mRNA decay protein 3